MPLLLVRHAHARARKEWSGEDSTRPLTSQGQRQANGLVSLASKFALPTRLISSPYLRCLQTVAPLAEHLSLSVEQDARVSEGQSAPAVALVREVAGTGTVVVCTHGDVIVEVLVALADEDRVDLGPRPKQAKGSVWVLEAVDGHFVSAEYLPPVSPAN